MKIQRDQIDAIILDLGGVILNINYQLTIDAFQKLGFDDFQTQYSKLQQSGLFDQLETGRISEEEFVREIQVGIPDHSAEEIIRAWNAMLLDFPEGRIDTLENLQRRIPSFLLSNTNAVHLSSFTQTLQSSTGRNSLDDLFQKTYLSHEIGMRKPNHEVFELILEENGLTPARTLFIDDSPQHVQAASELGIQTIHHRDEDKLEELLSPLLA